MVNGTKKNEVNESSEKVRKVTQIITDAEARTCTFTKKYKIRGKNKTGTFTFKYPSLFDRTQIGVARAKMLDGAQEQSLDKVTSDLTYIIAYLGKLCIKHPSWFNLNLIEEYEVLTDLFEEVSKWVTDFRLSMEKSENDGNSNSTEYEDDMDSNEAI